MWIDDNIKETPTIGTKSINQPDLLGDCVFEQTIISFNGNFKGSYYIINFSILFVKLLLISSQKTPRTLGPL